MWSQVREAFGASLGAAGTAARLAVLLLAGCAPSYAHAKAADLAALAQADLCAAYHDGHPPTVRAELERRGAIAAADWPDVEARTIRVGMSQCALLASWGIPGLWGNVNRSVTAAGTETQWVYRDCDACEATYVYTERGVVTGWQD